MGLCSLLTWCDWTSLSYREGKLNLPPSPPPPSPTDRERVQRENIRTYFFLSSWAGGILQILQSDWFRERAVFSPSGPLTAGGSFRNHLLGFRKKKCYSLAKVGPYWEKLCPLSCVPPSGSIQDLGHSFSQYGPPLWWRTYRYIFAPYKGYCVYYPCLRTAYCVQRGMFSFECSLVRLEEQKKSFLSM